jgi:hypothetical protein
MNRRLAAALVATLTSAAFVAPAAAQAPGELAPAAYAAPPAPEAPSKIERSYALQLAGADLASLATMMIGASGQSEEVVRLGSLGYLFAAPAVHALNGNGTRAAQSLALRVTLPLAGMFIGFFAGPSDEGGDCCGDVSFTGALVGGGIGVATALVVDYTLFGKKTERAPTRSWQPTVGASQNGFSVGAMGRF